MVDLEWDDEEDNEVVNAENDGAVSGEEEEVIEELVSSPQTGENGRESSSSDERRARRPPRWMRDYVDGAGGMYQNYQGQETVEPESRMGNFPDEHQNAARVTGDVQEVERSQVSAYSED
ncbi:hypothetical protein F0562_011190 [Nyssa sinensis]|uniref:Btz domain-containing protein n=1 Tax=Nyssa sinensis TaxID=561372 RepID=A0A5J5A5Z7_9ASTE|nr:hypothetical protein F0562_011190 [Nyssa sinensis]